MDTVSNFNNSAIAGSTVVAKHRTVWMASFGFFSLVLFAVSPGLTTAILLAVVLSAANIVGANRLDDFDRPEKRLVPTLAGSLLAAILLWISALSGASLAGYMGLGSIVASILSAALYAVLVAGESFMAAMIQFVSSANNTSGLKIAYLIDRKFAGFLGEIR